MLATPDHDRLHFQSQLQSLLAQGKGVPESLGILATAFDGKLQPMIVAASKDAGATSLAALIDKQPQLFDPDLAGLLRATGDTGLGSFFSSYRKFRLESGASLQAIRKRLLGGLIYFGYVGLFALGCMFVLAAFVLPKLRELMQADDSGPGAGTLLVILVAMALLALIAGTWLLLLFFPPYATSATRLYLRGLRWMPGASSFLKSWIVSTSLGHLALLLEAGVPAEKAMKAVEPAAPIRLPAKVLRRIQISERAGTLASQIREIAADQDFDAFKNADRMITGYLIVTYIIFGAWVGFPMLRIYMPIFKLGGSI